MVVHRQVPVCVVAHHIAGMHLGRAAPLVHVGLDKAAVLVLQLVVDRAATVRRVLRLGQLRHRQLVHTEAQPVVLRELPATVVVDVCHPRLQSVQLRPAALQTQIAEHVIERAVFHHQHDDVLDLFKRVHGGIDLNLDPTPITAARSHQPGLPSTSRRMAARLTIRLRDRHLLRQAETAAQPPRVLMQSRNEGCQ